MPNPDPNPHSDEFLDELETATDVTGKAAAQALALAARLAADPTWWRLTGYLLPAAEDLDRAHGWLDHTLWRARKRPGDIEADTDQINLPSTSGTGSGGHPLRGSWGRAFPEVFRADLEDAEARAADAVRKASALAARAALDGWWWMAASLLGAAGDLARAHGELLGLLEAEDKGRSEGG